MPRLIDADSLNVYKAWVEIRTEDDAVVYSGKRKIVLADDIANAPTVDAEPVVHCKDCKGQIIPMCWTTNKPSNGFCSWGERRKDETD